MKSNIFNALSSLGDGSGISTFLDSRVKTFLNSYGYYEEKYFGNDVVNLNPLISKVSASFICESSRESAKSIFSKHDGIKLNKEIGYHRSLYIGHVNDLNSRMASSSGGIGTWIPFKLMKEGKIDYFIHVKKNPNKTSKILFTYQISNNVNEIFDGAKTKYYPVELSKVLKVLKNKPGKYAIIGIPSIIRSIKKLAQVDDLINERIRYCIVLICGHQKSTKFADYMGWQVGIFPGKLTDIDFRHKIKEKPANNYGIKISGNVDGNSKTFIESNLDLDGQDWGHGYFKVPHSDFTDDVFGECGDIVIGDAWLPGYMEDSKGTNIIITRSSEMEELIKRGLSSKELKLTETDPKTILKSQSPHFMHTYQELPHRAEMANKMLPKIPKLFTPPKKNISLFRKAIQKTRLKIASQSHLIFNKAEERKSINYFKNRMSYLKFQYRMLYLFIGLKNKIFKKKNV